MCCDVPVCMCTLVLGVLRTRKCQAVWHSASSSFKKRNCVSVVPFIIGDQQVWALLCMCVLLCTCVLLCSCVLCVCVCSTTVTLLYRWVPGDPYPYPLPPLVLTSLPSLGTFPRGWMPTSHLALRHTHSLTVTQTDIETDMCTHTRTCMQAHRQK